ncbi:MAG TPA: 4a-hydroxytetrahydrobiopterin dehydratase [Methanomicrobiales archaeon]|jgi:4a-hydroxytetrahydrobiopterin dehydratase|nr:4a-hydroxytetrahydrobiopterin dehydratase [Methanomicrobiales archaeon]
MDLAQEKCTPIEPGTPPLTRQRLLSLVREVPGWALEGTRLNRRFTCKNFIEAVKFLNQVSMIAAEEMHYPEMCITEQRQVTISLYTHASGGITLNDLILAAKISDVWRKVEAG